jgi:hypothetical protein
LRARPIWFTASNTTRAPPARANSAVPSDELLSHTIVSVSHPRAAQAVAASRRLPNVAPISFSSLYAGTTIDILIRPTLLAFPPTKQLNSAASGGIVTEVFPKLPFQPWSMALSIVYDRRSENGTADL